MHFLSKRKKKKKQYHYENMPIQIYWKIYHQKNWNFQTNNSDIFHISAQNIDCGYSLEPPWPGGSNEYPQSMFLPGGSNEYPQSMFLSRNKKNNVCPCKPQIYTPVNPSVCFFFIESCLSSHRRKLALKYLTVDIHKGNKSESKFFFSFKGNSTLKREAKFFRGQDGLE